jgi:tetratricopeptide (TPR) repeat protein
VSTRADLGTLEASGLIEIAALQPELEYLFRHALVQEAAYASLLKQDRRSLHRAAAETILALHPDRTRELAGVIGMHFEQAGDGGRAAEYLVVAGEHALERFANREAIAFFTRAGALADASQVDLKLRAAIGKAKAGWTFIRSPDELEQLRGALEATDGADPLLVAEANFWVAFLLRQRGDLPERSPELRAALERAAKLGTELGDPTTAALPKALMGTFTSLTGELRAGARQMSEALEVLEKKGDAVAIAMIADFLAMAYSRLGDFAAAEDAIARAKKVAGGDGDAISRLDADIAQSALHLERGEPDKAYEDAQRCSIKAEDLGAYACAVAANVMFGAASLARDDATGAKGPLERGSELCQLTNMAPMQTLLNALLGSTRARLGDMPGGIVGWNEALAGARSMNDRYGEAQTLWGRGRTYAHESNPDLGSALEDLNGAVALMEQMEARPGLARALHDRAFALRGLGRKDEAARDEERSQQLGRELGLKDLKFA